MNNSLDQIKSELDQLTHDIEETISISQDTSQKLRGFVNRVHDLKQNLEHAKIEPIQSEEPKEEIPPIEIIPEPTPEIPVQPQIKDNTQEVQIGQKLLLIVGVVLLVFGIGYFLKYSFDQNWVGPAGRVAMAYLGAMSLLGIGELFRRKDFERFGLYLIGGGIASLYFSSYAGYYIYELFSQGTAFALMCMVTIFAGTLSIIYNQQWLSILGIIGGFMTPIILSDGSGNYKVLLSYMAVLNFGILAISTFRTWNLLPYLGAFLNWTIFTSWMLKSYNLDLLWFPLTFIQIYFVQYSLIPFNYYLRNKEKISEGRFFLTAFNLCFALGCSYFYIDRNTDLPWLGIISLSYVLVYLGLGQILVNKCKENLDSLFILISQALVVLTLTIPILFSDHWVTSAWALFAAGIIWFSLRIGYIKTLYIGILLYILSYGNLWINYHSVFDLNGFEISFPSFFETFLDRYITLICVLGSGIFSTKWIGKKDYPTVKKFFGTMVLFYIFLFSNIELMAFFNEFYPNATFAAISVWWAIFSIGFMIVGFIKNAKVFRTLSMILFGTTVIKVFLFDMAQVSTPYRIISFIILGILLIGASYLYYKYKDQLLDSNHEKENH